MKHLFLVVAFFAHSAAAQTAPPALLNRCMRCHTGPQHRAPEIPYDKPADLKRLLNSNIYDRGTLLEEIKYRTDLRTDPDDRMPPNGEVRPEEREQLIQYLTELAGT